MDDELIKVCGLAACVGCRRMTPRHLKALSDSVEQVCCLPAGVAWDRKAVAHAEIVNLLADSTADPLLVLLVRNVPGHLYDLMVTVGPAADGMIASSRCRLLALIRVRDADGARREMEQHDEGLRLAAISATAMAGGDPYPVAIGPLRVNRYLNPSRSMIRSPTSGLSTWPAASAATRPRPVSG